MINKIYIIILLNITLFTCNAFGQAGYELKGKFSSFKNIHKLELVEINIEGEKLIDTCTINSAGEFVFKGHTKTPNFYFIKYSTSELIPVFVDLTTKINIIIDPTNSEIPYTVSGDLENESVQYFVVKNLACNKINSGSNAKRVKDLQKQISEKEISAGSLYAAYYLMQIGTVNDSILEFLPLCILQNEMFYMELDKKSFDKYTNLPLCVEVHDFIKERNESPTAIGKQFDNFTLNNSKGKPISLTDYTGKYILVDFWASWCEPCRIENPNLVQAYQKFHNKGFEILGVSLDTKKNAWKTAILADDLTWGNVCELTEYSSLATKLGILDIPFNVLLDKDRKIIAKNLRGGALEEKLKEVFD